MLTRAQSVVRTSAIQPFLNRFKFTQIRNLGGKLGAQIAAHFKTESLPQLLEATLPQLQAFLPDDTATWVYNAIRGVERAPIAPKSAVQSMLAAKTFRAARLPSLAACQPWVDCLAADLALRLATDECARRPRSIALTFTDGAGSRTRTAPKPPSW